MKPEPTDTTNQIAAGRDDGSRIGESETHTTSEARVPAEKRRRGSIRLWLATLVVACVLPVWVAAGFLVYYNYQSRRALTEQRMLETARALAMVVDREIIELQASLSALGTANSLDRGELAVFYRRAQKVLEGRPGADIVLADATGQQLVNTYLPFGSRLPKRNAPDAVRQIYLTERPLITNAFKGALTGRLMISVDVPVLRDGRVIYDLAMTVPADRFAKVLLQEHLPPDWIGGVIDSNQIVVARTHLAEQFVGRRVGPVLGQRIKDNAEGMSETVNLKGVLMFNSFSRAATSSWTVVIGAPKEIMMAEIWRWLWWTIAGIALLSLAGVALALLMARRISGSIQALIAPVLALGRGESVAIRPLELTEFAEAGESLLKASQLIQQRAAEHERAEAARRVAEELKRFNTELERSEAEARARATELVAILDAVPAGTFIAHDPECQRITSNRVGYELLRLPPGVNASKSAPEGERPSNYRLLRDGSELSPEEMPMQLAAAGREIRDYGYTIAFDDGSSREIFGNAVPLLDERGRLRGAVGAFIDITDRIRTERQFQATAERLKAILEHAPVGIVTNDRECYLIEPNPAYQRICGYSAEELTGKKFTDHTYPEDMAKTLQSYAELGSNKLQSYEMEKRYIRKDGKLIWVRVIASRINEETNIGIIEDITDRKRSEQLLRESEERFRQVVEGAPVGMCIESDGLFRYLNPAAVAMFGAGSAGNIVGQAILDRIHPDSLAAVSEHIRLLKETRRSIFLAEERHLRLDGTVFDAELTAMPFLFEGREGTAVFVRDITEHKRQEDKRRALEEQLRQSQKMEAVGKLAGGIAHDFNNLLMVIQSYTEMLENSIPAHDALRTNTQQIMKAANRAASLTRQMLAFSRKQILSPVVLDLNAVIDETANMLRRLIGEDIDFRVSAAESLWAIEVDADQIVQVLMNLCVNARDAMCEGGTLTIATGNATVEEGSVGKQGYVSPGDYVWLSVTDTGTGISKDIQKQIFDPFFTTKEVGKGTGLGLSTVYGIVKQSGGDVWVDSEPGQGTCFRIYLPRVKRAIDPDTSANTEARPRGAETILIAEDEEALREAICDYLCSLGYTVLAAGSGEEALSVAGQHDGHIDLLITDVVMPGMSGRELSQMLASLCPDLKSIYMSGYTDDAVLRRGIEKMDATLLQKPFSLGTIARKVRETLGRSGTVQ
jgi:PAS domain S-box-containing protein